MALSLFQDLATRLHWRPQDRVLILWAYFDESGHTDDPNVHAVCVAGAVATTQAWTRLERDWKTTLRAFRVKELHMKYLAHFRGEYQGWDEPKRQKFLGQLLPLMKRHVSQYIGAAMPLLGNWHGHSDQELRDRLRDPYYGCLIFCLEKLAAYVSSLPKRPRVNIIMARHPEFSGDFAKELFKAAQVFEENGGLQLGSIDFDQPKDMPALQVGDLVAYELRRYAADRDRGITTARWPMRQIRQKGVEFLTVLERRVF